MKVGGPDIEAVLAEEIDGGIRNGFATWSAPQAPNNSLADAGSLVTRRISDIEAHPIDWLWPDRIARGKVNLIVGNPGLGKSQITASIAAVVTTGGRWPVDGRQCQVGSVLFLSAEDDPADTLRPRLEAAGADLTRVHVIDGVVQGYTGSRTRRDRIFYLDEDLPALESKLLELSCVAAVVIDPISAYLGTTDSHKNAEVRGLLAPLSELAARRRVAVIAVSHLSKAVGSQPLNRVMGSLAFVAAARGAYLVAPDPTVKHRRPFVPLKNNLGPDEAGLAFFIEGATVPSAGGPLETSRVVWSDEAVHITADEVMQSECARSTSALEEAGDFLKETLSVGPIAARVVCASAKAEGITERTLRRACKSLGIRVRKNGMEGGWVWSIPSKAANSAEDGQQDGLATFGKIGPFEKFEQTKVEP